MPPVVLQAGAAIPAEFREDADFYAMEGPRGDESDTADNCDTFLANPDRHGATPERCTLVFVPVGWSGACGAAMALAPYNQGEVLPDLRDVAAYLTAFTGLPTRLVPEMRAAAWDGAAGARKYIGLVSLKESSVGRVRVRADPAGVFAVQLNVNDVLDALTEDLPCDAFAIVGLTPYDIHDDGAPVTGRAYGGRGSRACRSRGTTRRWTKARPDGRWACGGAWAAWRSWPLSRPRGASRASQRPRRAATLPFGSAASLSPRRTRSGTHWGWITVVCTRV